MLWVVDTCWKVFLTFMLPCSPLTRNKSSLLALQEWEVVFFSFYYSAGCATVAKENERKSYLPQALDGGVETQDLRGERFRKGQQRCRCICDLESLVKSLLGWKWWAFLRINMSRVIIKLKKMPKGKRNPRLWSHASGNFFLLLGNTCGSLFLSRKKTCL